jgi:hypothetical protein
MAPRKSEEYLAEMEQYRERVADSVRRDDALDA